MPLSVDDRLGLLRTLSYARNNSHASIDTISDSSLVAFLQVQDTLREIGSRRATVSTIDILLPILLSLSLDKVALPLVRFGGRAILSRVANSRVVVGKFSSNISGVQTTTTTQLYAGVQRRFDFDKFEDVLAAQRIEQAVLRYGEKGMGGMFTSVAPGEVKRLMKRKPPVLPTPPGTSPTVSIVESALVHAVNQKYITGVIFDDMQESVRLDTTLEFSDFEPLVKDLASLYEPLQYGSATVTLDQLRSTFTHSFEEFVWSAVLLGDNPRKTLPQAGTGSEARIQYFRDTGKDIALTSYLLKRFARAREYYSETSSKNFHRASQKNLMVERFRMLATRLDARKSDYTASGKLIEVGPTI